MRTTMSIDIEDLIFTGEWSPGYECTKHIKPFQFEVLHLKEDGTTDPVGTLQFFILYAPPCGVPYWALWDEADCESSDLCDVVETFFGKGGPLSEDSREAACVWTLLYFDSIHINPAFRGQDLSLKILRAIVDRYAQEIHVAIRPSPLEEQEDVSPQDATRKLRAHWQQMGFNSKVGPYLWHNVTTLPNWRATQEQHKAG
jgi:GNAT superfamily N-acetyltransferase